MTRQKHDPASTPAPLAIVGMSCRLPGNVKSPDEFWEMLHDSRSGHSLFPADRFNPDTFYHPDSDRKDCINTRHGYFISQDVTTFDAAMFQMVDTEAAALGPQHRILLECAFEAFEDAGLPREAAAGRNIGVFATFNECDYSLERSKDMHSCVAPSVVMGNSTMLANAISFYYDLKGPSVTVATACSSTTTALHQAAQLIRKGEIEFGLIAACALNMTPARWTMLSNFMMLNPNGKATPFDRAADSGYARGEGGGCLVVKSLEQALNDNDRIYCVITDVGINHDGSKPNITLPGEQAQATLMSQVCERAGINPNDIGFIEAHAPGTRVGDPVELASLFATYGVGRSASEPLLLGSSKSNVGHLEAASGIPSLIKTAMILKKGTIVPTVGFERENEKAPLRSRNLEVPVQPRPWPKGKRYAAVNNFGFGGTNGHCLLEAAPTHPCSSAHAGDEDVPDDPKLFVLSANDEDALSRRREHLGEFLKTNADVSLRNLAYTLCERRSHMAWRGFSIASSLDELAASLAPEAFPSAVRERRVPRLGFVFSGQGVQYHGMGRQLFRAYPVFRQGILDADAVLADLGAPFSLADILFSEGEDSEQIHRAEISQPASTAIQIALVKLLRAWGIEPMAVVGHSSGEMAAAFAAGIISSDTAMRAAYARGQLAGKLREQQPELRGGMLAVNASAGVVTEFMSRISSGLAVIACENSDVSVTVSGDMTALDELEAALQSEGYGCNKLTVNVPYHSPYLEEAADAFNFVEGLDPEPEENHKSTFYSAVYGYELSGIGIDSSYWAASVKSPVQFTQAFKAMMSSQAAPEVIVEIGPHRPLLGPVKQILAALGHEKLPCVFAMERQRNSHRTALAMCGRLFSLGVPLDFSQINLSFQGRRPRLVEGLKPYPWSRQKHWLESRLNDEVLHCQFPHHDLLGRPLAGYSGGEMAWSNVLQPEDLPWLHDHQVNDDVVFPLAGYISTAISAATQLAEVQGAAFDGFRLTNVRVLHPLFVRQGVRCDFNTKLRPTRQGWHEFEISSWDSTTKHWVHNCRGFISARENLGVDTNSSSPLFDKSRAACDCTVDGPTFYRDFATYTPERGPTFQNLASISYNKDAAVGEVVISDTSATMSHKYETVMTIHPATLDGLFQCIIPLVTHDHHGPNNIWLPAEAREVSVSCGVPHDAGARLQVLASAASDPNVYSLVATDGAHTRITVDGLVMRPATTGPDTWPHPMYSSYKQVWQPASPTPPPPSSENGNVWLVVYSEEKFAPLAEAAVRHLAADKHTASACPLAQATAIDGAGLVVCGLPRCLLSEGRRAEYEKLQQLISAMSRAVFVTQGSHWKVSDPESSSLYGFVRTLRYASSYGVATLDLDSDGETDVDGQAKLLADVARRISNSGGGEQGRIDMEFAEDRGTLIVPRFTEDTVMRDTCYSITGDCAPVAQVLRPDRRIKLTPSRFGTLESMYFEDDDMDTPLGDGELEVYVAATGVTTLDALNASKGQSVGTECSGIVSRVGGKAGSFVVGDNVCCLAQNAYGTFARCKANRAVKLSQDADLTAAASLPVDYSTAVYALRHVARLRAGDRVLVHTSRAGALGHAVAKVAASMGADLFVTASSDDEREFLTGGHGIPPGRVCFGSGPDSLATALRQAIGPSGVDLEINPIPNNAVAGTQRFLVPFGHFIQIGTDASVASTRPDIYGNNTTFSQFDMAVVAKERPRLLDNALAAVRDLVASSSVLHLFPSRMLSVIPRSQLADAFRHTLEQSTPMVKYVVAPRADDAVMTMLPKVPDLALRSDGCYVIVGGTGGLGKKIAAFIAEKGASNIFLLSRGVKPQDEAVKLVGDLRERGVFVEIKSCDVTDKSQLDSVLRECVEAKGVIRGVIHAATAWGKSLDYQNTTYEDYLATMRPKIQGAMNLHEAFLDCANLDFFILLSSASGTFGMPKYIPYAAGNSFLDGLAAYRVRMGLPGASIALGFITDVGFLADYFSADKFDIDQVSLAFGLEGEVVTSNDIMARLSASIMNRSDTCNGFSVFGLGFGNDGSTTPLYYRDARFSQLSLKGAGEKGSGLGSGGKKATGVKTTSLLSKLRKADAETALNLVLEGLVSEVARLLFMTEDAVRSAKTTFELGLDSFTMVELLNWVATELHLRLSMHELADIPTLRDLGLVITGKLKA